MRLHTLKNYTCRGIDAMMRHVFWMIAAASVNAYFAAACFGVVADVGQQLPDIQVWRIQAESAFFQGKAQDADGNYPQAIEYYTQAAKLFQTAGDRRKEADVASDLAVVYRKSGDFDHSLTLQQQAVAIYIELDDVQNQAKALRRLGVLYRYQGKFSQSISSQESALTLLQKEDDQSGVAMALTNLGAVYGDLGRLQDARRYFEQALEIYTRLKNQEGISYVLGNLGQLLLYSGDSEQALVYLTQSLDIKKSLSDTRGEANTVLNSGTAYKNLGNLQHAFELYYQALDLYDRLNDAYGKAVVLGSIGTTYEELGDLKQAQEFQLQSLTVKKQIGAPVQVSVALTNLASLAIKLQRFSEADAYLQEAFTIAKDHQSLLSQANILGQIGVSHLAQNSDDEALQDFSHSMELYEQLGSQKGILETLDFFGQAYIKRAAYTDAFAYYERALRLANEINDSNALWMVQYRLGEIWLNRGDDTQALTYFQDAITTLERIRSDLETPEFRRLFMRKNLNPYTQMIRLLLKAGKYEDALLYVERLKARTFLESVAHSEPQFPAAPEMVREEKYLAARIRFLNDKLSAKPEYWEEPGEFQPIRKASDEIAQELNQAKAQYEQLLMRIKLQYPDYYRLKIVDAGEIQQLIRQAAALVENDVVILEYFLDEEDAHVWIIEADSIRYQRLPVAHRDLLAAILQFRTELTGFDMDTVIPPLRNLYDWLIAPIQPYLAGKRIVGIVPFEILHFVPFGALIQSAPDSLGQTPALPHYFIDDYALFSLPSLSMLPVVREKALQSAEQAKIHPRGYFLGMGNAIEDLPGATEEIQAVLHQFPHSTGYFGKEATKKRFLEEAGEYDIVHLATHGEYDKQHPMFSSLKFASDVLYAREIFGMRLWATLVTLSGCETLLPQNADSEESASLVTGDELVGFIRAFMYAGASSILSSLWRVSDMATQYLMNAFYRELPQKGKAIALQQACQSVIHTTATVGRHKKRDISLAHPFFWSPFVLIGDWK